MKKFSFKLEKVLELREFEEEQAKIELGKAIAETERINEELRLIAEKRVQNSKNRFSTGDVMEQLAIENYITRLDSEKERLLEELAQAELVVEQKRSVFAESLKNRKVISKLKEKRAAEYKKEFYKTEENEIDDVFTSKNDQV